MTAAGKFFQRLPTRPWLASIGGLLLAAGAGTGVALQLFGEPLVVVMALAAICIAIPAVIWVVQKPKAAFFAVLYGTQFATLLTKLLDTRLFLYASYILPLVLLAIIVGKPLLATGSIPVPRSSIFLLVALFTTLLILEIGNPEVPALSVAINDLFAKYLLHIAGFGLGIWLIRKKADYYQVARIIAISGTLAALYALYQNFVGYPAFESRWATQDNHLFHGVNIYQGEDRRELSTLLYSATYGAFSAICAYQTLPLLALSRTRRARAALIAALCLMVAGMFLSLTRGVWVGVVAGLGLWAVLGWRHVVFKVGLHRIFLFLAGVVALCLMVTPIRVRLLTFGNIFNEQYDARFGNWINFWLPQMSNWHLLTGYGLGLVGSGSERYFDLRVAFWGTSSGVTDNSYLLLFVSMGIVGLLTFLLLSWLALLQAYRLGHRLRDPFLRAWALSTFLTLVLYLAVFMSSDQIIDSYPVNLFFWLFLGMLVRLPLVDRQEAASISA